MPFIHQLHPLLVEGDSYEAKVNREMYSATFPIVWIQGELLNSNLEMVGEYFVSGIYDNIIPKRPLVVAEMQLKDGACFRQPFYMSSGTATPEISPKGTWWPFSALWTPEYLDSDPQYDGLPVGWVGKYLWNPKNSTWILHNKKVERLLNYKHIVDLLASSIARPKYS